MAKFQPHLETCPLCGSTFNPFDKQQLKEKDQFISKDFIDEVFKVHF